MQVVRLSQSVIRVAVDRDPTPTPVVLNFNAIPHGGTWLLTEKEADAIADMLRAASRESKATRAARARDKARG